MSAKIIRRLLGVVGLLVAGSSLAGASPLYLTYYIDVFGNGVPTTVNPCNPICTPTLQLGGYSTVLNLPELNQSGANVAIGEAAPGAGYIWALSAVQLTLNWASNGTVSLFNIDNVPINFSNATADVAMTLVSGGVTITSPGIAGPITGTANPEGVTSFPGQTGSGAVGDPAGNMSLFEGSGTHTVSASATNGLQNFGGSENAGQPAGELFFGGSSRTGAILSVQYTYNEVSSVPEPVTMALVGSALLGLGAFARARRAKRA